MPRTSTKKAVSSPEKIVKTIKTVSKPEKVVKADKKAPKKTVEKAPKKVVEKEAKKDVEKVSPSSSPTRFKAKNSKNNMGNVRKAFTTHDLVKEIVKALDEKDSYSSDDVKQTLEDVFMESLDGMAKTLSEILSEEVEKGSPKKKTIDEETLKTKGESAISQKAFFNPATGSIKFRPSPANAKYNAKFYPKYGIAIPESFESVPDFLQDEKSFDWEDADRIVKLQTLSEEIKKGTNVKNYINFSRRNATINPTKGATTCRAFFISDEKASEEQYHDWEERANGYYEYLGLGENEDEEVEVEEVEVEEGSEVEEVEEGNEVEEEGSEVEE